MKPRGIVLGLLAVIFALLAILGYIIFSPATVPILTRQLGGQKVITNTITQIAVRKVNATNLLSALGNRPLSWGAIESTNYAVYIANLRSFGCPEETIRDIILTDVAKLYAKRRAALRGKDQPYKFWHAGAGWEDGYGTNPEIQRQLRELEKEQRALVKELLGVDYQMEMSKYWLDEDYEERRYGFLPQEKREKLLALQEKYDELEQELYLKTKGLMLEEDRQLLRKIQEERQEKLAQILTPEESEEYELRNSNTANNLRTQLTGFEPTEEEFREIFRLQKLLDEEVNQAFEPDDPATAQMRTQVEQESQEALKEELKKVLGEKRYAEYERAQDGDYQSLVQLTERLELPKDLAGRLYNMKQEAEKQRQRIIENANLTDEQRQAALAAIARETERSVSQAMGAKNFQTYQKSGASWIDGLTLFERAPAVENEVVP